MRAPLAHALTKARTQPQKAVVIKNLSHLHLFGCCISFDSVPRTPKKIVDQKQSRAQKIDLFHCPLQADSVPVGCSEPRRNRRRSREYSASKADKHLIAIVPPMPDSFQMATWHWLASRACAAATSKQERIRRGRSCFLQIVEPRAFCPKNGFTQNGQMRKKTNDWLICWTWLSDFLQPIEAGVNENLCEDCGSHA
jgi:hypothetical protein